MDTLRPRSKSLSFINNDCAITTSSLILFIFQMIIILIVISVSIYNLSKQTGDTNLWTALLSSSIGYVLPNPTLKPMNAENKK